ncbi:MAG: DNA polymerase III subunit epsilon, partial [Atopobiaceae bacterium]|nr:DNA polymerase III subunit epsilon [Atopobiaceae bacterium]
ELITTTSDRCERGRCPFFPSGCLVHGSRRRAAGADVVITNHSLLLRNVEADGRILPPIRHWVVDEAHSFEQEARRQWAVEASAERSRSCFEALGGIRTGAIHALLAQAAGTEASTLLMGLLTKAASSVSRASFACGDFFDALRGLAPFAGSNSGYDNLVIWIDEGVRSTPEWAALSVAGEHAKDLLDKAIGDLDDANAAIAESIPDPTGDLQDATRSLKELLDAITITVSGTDTSYVYSAQLTRGNRGVGTEKLVAEKLDVGSELAERWYPELASVVFTSATMAVGEDFSHFSHSVGLDRLEPGSYRTLRLDSSYDFDGSMGVALTPDLPDPNSSDYLTALEDLLFDVHVAMDGSVLTLFTNRREMEQVYAGLAPRLSERGLDLMMQERSSSARQIRERFLAEKSLSLLALRSFWEGFDAGGDTLRCVVIPKLPFASPRDPLVRERDRREERAWWRYSLPEAVLSVKQAAGRLIRTATDTGVLVIADSRLFTKRYGRAFVNSLPSRSCVKVPSEEIAEHIRNWRRLHER